MISYRVGGGVDLAVIIPAYKSRFLDRTLQSIADQSDKRFRVYVADDGSPEDIASIVAKYRYRLDVQYKRFDENLGGTSLTSHWNRAIALSHEEWIWLFSDDDMMDVDCVKAFHDTVQSREPGAEVYRFDTDIIDEHDRIVELNPRHPRHEPAALFLYFFLRGLRNGVMPDHVFARAAYDKVGGIPDFPLAWCSDRAFTLSMAADTGFHLVEGPVVRFRQSGANISSSKEKRHNRHKVQAAMEFVGWLRRFVAGSLDTQGVPNGVDLDALIKDWFTSHLWALHYSMGRREALELARFYNREWRDPLRVGVLRVLKIAAGNAVRVASQRLAVAVGGRQETLSAGESTQQYGSPT